MEHWKVLATKVGWQGKILNSRRSRMAKIVAFWPWWQPFSSFYFETLSFFLCFPFFLFATQKRGRTPLVPLVSPALKSPYSVWIREAMDQKKSFESFCTNWQCRRVRIFRVVRKNFATERKIVAFDQEMGFINKSRCETSFSPCCTINFYFLQTQLKIHNSKEHCTKMKF